MFSEEVSELGLDATQRLGIPMKQQYHVHHGEALTHQGQQVTKELCQDESQFTTTSITMIVKCWDSNVFFVVLANITMRLV